MTESKQMTKGRFSKPTITNSNLVNFNSKQIICIWGEPVTGKTDGLVALADAGYTIDLINLDDNVRPFKRLPNDKLANINNIKLSDSLGKFNVADFFDEIRSVGTIKICTKHGYIDCKSCKAGGKYLMYNPKKSVADVTVIDSASAYLDSSMIKAKQDSATAKTTFNNFGMQGLHVDVLHHFVKALDNHVIVVCHDIQLANTLKENYTDNYYPLLGTRPKSKRSMNIYTAVLRSIKNKDTYQVSEKPTHFATLRNKQLEKELTNKPRFEILKSLLGEPNSSQA